MKLNSIILFVLFFVPSIFYGQQNKKEIKAQKQIELIKEINEAKSVLRDGAMLVRLNTKNISIDLMRNSGKEREADITEKRQVEYNKLIVKAFKENFTLCPTYFFFSDESQKILDGAVKDITFLNENLQPDAAIEFTQGDFLVAEFGAIEQEEGEYYDSEIKKSGDEGVVSEKVYYGATDFGFPALVVRDKNLIQMKKPFPYYVRTFSSLPMKRSVAKSVKKLNQKLKEFI